MTTDTTEYVFEGETIEEIIANASGNLVMIIYDVAQEAEIDRCVLFDNAIQTFALNMHKNGHGGCATKIMVDALMLLKSLHDEDAEQPRH